MWRNFFRNKRSGVGEYLKWLRRQDGDIGLFHSIKPKEASYGSFGSLDPEIINSLKNKGIEGSTLTKARLFPWHLQERISLW